MGNDFEATLNLEAAITAFVRKFEDVFDRDWPYTRNCLLALLTVDDVFVTKGGTFLHPGVEDEFGNNWGNRGALLQSYRRLKTELEAGREQFVPRAKYRFLQAMLVVSTVALVAESLMLLG